MNRRKPFPSALDDFPRRGVALVLVLSLIVLLSALVIAFMSSSRNDLIATTHYKAGQEAMSLAETADSLVMAQIREATLSGITAQGKGRHAWASQPGAIRVWDDAGAPAQPFSLYKLYSASLLKETSMGFLTTEIPANWRARPEEFVDLNEPVAKGTGANLVWRYPILNPDALGVVEGFSSQQTADATVAWNSKTSMPVRWLYVGRGGALSNSLQPDSVGRIAFWTDDETCKVNINTASATASLATVTTFPPGTLTAGSDSLLGYSYWDLPYTQLLQDINMARAAPAQAEYQRYPGHPAGVNLLGVFSGTFAALTESAQKTTLKNAFELFPAYKWGGSENGRIPWTLASTMTPLSGTNQKNQRLYASVDELRFKATVTAPPLRDKNALPVGTQADETRLDYWRFFLTAHSRAPDVNLFGQPRVTIWPVSATNDSLHRTAQDKLIAFCSTYGPQTSGAQKEYFFKRKNPLSQTEDWTDIPRNQSLFAYLQDLTGREIPGFGGNFRQKYDIANGGVAGERNQILTGIFDYIRCVNLNEAFEFKPAGFQSYTPEPATGSAYSTYKGAGMVLPIQINTSRGAGRVPVLSEVALFAMQQGIDQAGSTIGSGKVQTALFFETFSPMHGFMPWAPKDFQLSARTGMTVAGQAPFPGAGSGVTTPAINRGITAVAGSANMQPEGGTDGFAWTLGIPLGELYGWGTDSTSGYYRTPVFARNRSNAIPLPVGALKLDIAPGDLDVNFIMAGVTYQSYKLQFPAASMNIPDPGTPGSNPGDPTWDSTMDWIRRYASKGVKFTSENAAPFRHDVAHSLVPKDGDYRIIAYLQDVPSGFFRKHPDYGSDKNFAHSLRQLRHYGLMGASINEGTTNGTFVNLPYGKADFAAQPNWHYFWTAHPDIPPDITSLIGKGWAGDWNNGLGDFPDGAYLGKSDDGDRATAGGSKFMMYMGGEFTWSSGTGFFSPTQQMPSAVMFGSLPTGVKRTYDAYRSGNDSNAQPWRTLLFCANPAAGSGHFGMTSPKDSLLLDLFTMPVVEPYAISEPSSTAGRINMNYQILPFTTIERSTGLYAVFSSQRVTALPDSIADIRQGNPDNAIQAAIQANTTPTRLRINMPETLIQFTDRFAPGNNPANGDLFHSAAEICSLFFVPKGGAATLAGMPAWWAIHRVTGDNLRERPYATTYPLLTTKSNTYTVHVWAQSLAPGTNKVTGEYRGATTLERYLDPGDDRLVAAANDPDTKSLEPLYRFRVTETKRFAP